MALGLGQLNLKPDTTGSSQRGRPASDFSTFPLIGNIIYIPSLGVKVQSDAHFSVSGLVVKCISLNVNLTLKDMSVGNMGGKGRISQDSSPSSSSSLPFYLYLHLHPPPPPSPQILLGEDDLDQLYKFVIRVAEEIVPIIPKAPPPEAPAPPLPVPVPSPDQPHPSENQPDVTVQVEGKEKEEEEEEGYERVRVMSNLSKFELKLFKGEPHFAVASKASHDLTKCGDFSLASLELVTMVLTMHLSSKMEVEVQATMKDIALINGLEETKKRNTG